MITFKQYLSEEVLTEAMVKKWFIEDIDVDTAVSVLNTYAKDGLKAIENGGLIFRGFKGGDTSTGFKAVDSSTGKRTSRDTDNLYQLMMTDSKRMAEYPDRSHSFICTTSSELAKAYGGPSGAFVMIPHDGTKIAISNVDDIFNVSMKIGDFYEGGPSAMISLSRFFRSFGAEMDSGQWTNSSNIRSALKGNSAERILLHWALLVTYRDREKLVFTDSENQKSWQMLILQVSNLRGTNFAVMRDLKILDELEKEMKDRKFHVSGKLESAYEFIKKNSKDLYFAMANELADPKTLKMQLVDFGNAIPPNRECWFSGKCIAISFPVFAKILLQLEEQDFPIHASVKKEFGSYMKYAKEKK